MNSLIEATWNFFKGIKVDSLVALTSLVVSYIALYRTNLKKGKLEIHLYNHLDDVEFTPGSRVEGINDNFFIKFPVMISNVGAGPVAIKDLQWNYEGAPDLNIDISPSANLSHLNIIKPYEQSISILTVHSRVKGYGKGHSEDYISLLRKIKGNVTNEKLAIKCTFFLCGKTKMEFIEKKYDISEVFLHHLTLNYLTSKAP